MTKKECAIVMAYTGVCMLEGSDMSIFTDYCEQLLGLGRPMQTIDYILMGEKIQELSKGDFEDICRSAGG